MTTLPLQDATVSAVQAEMLSAVAKHVVNFVMSNAATLALWISAASIVVSLLSVAVAIAAMRR